MRTFVESRSNRFDLFGKVSGPVVNLFISLAYSNFKTNINRCVSLVHSTQFVRFTG